MIRGIRDPRFDCTDIWSEPEARPEDVSILLTVTTADLSISLANVTNIIAVVFLNQNDKNYISGNPRIDAVLGSLLSPALAKNQRHDVALTADC